MASKKKDQQMHPLLSLLILFVLIGFFVSVYKLVAEPECLLLGESSVLLKVIAWWIFWPIMLFCDNTKN